MDNQTTELNLKVIYPDQFKSTHLIPADGLVIGRSADSDFVLEDEWISRQHCKLIHKDDTIWVEDMGSTNGTFVDGAEIQSSPLAIDSNLQLGKIVLKLEYAQSSQGPKLSPGETHALTGLKSYTSGQDAIESFFQEHNSLSFYNITLSFAEVAREDFGPDASDFLTYEVGRILGREILSDEILVHGNEFQYFLISSEIKADICESMIKDLSKLCARQVFSFEGSPLQGDIDISHEVGNLADYKEFLRTHL